MTLPPTPIVFLMGPTAAGKTDLAVRLVERLPADAVSVDSAMVYRGMDVGTGKPPPEVLARAPHRLIDVREVTETYSAGDFRRDASREIEDIRARGRIPLLVGGTLLYFRAGAMGRLGAESVRRSAIWLLESDLPLPGLSEAALHLHVLAGLDGGDGVVR